MDGLGDVSSDGIDDLVIGARNDNTAGTGTGWAYVVVGGEQGRRRLCQPP